jgi:preprotein translocase subunit SecF
MTVEKRNELFDAIKNRVGLFDVLEVDIIGPSIGEQLKKTSFIIVLAVSVAILMYCSWRFEFVFGLASIVALLHDALILLCMSALFKLEVNTAYVAALLTVLGYSINDTIVIFDRIREKLRKQDSDELSKSILNMAVNEMLPRSIHTSITTGLVVFSVFIFGGLSLKVFASVLIIGLITGTYSSLFIASPMVLTISKSKGVQIGQ